MKLGKNQLQRLMGLASPGSLLIVAGDSLRSKETARMNSIKVAARKRAEARLARCVPYDLDKEEKLDPMQVLEGVMVHFYRKAKIEEKFGPVLRFSDCGQGIRDGGQDSSGNCEFPASTDFRN